MKSHHQKLLLLSYTATAVLAAQTLYIPGGTVGSIGGSNVGIGTANPSQTLDVNGGINIGSGLLSNSAGQLSIVNTYPSITTTGTKYLKGVDIDAFNLPISSGVTENGYRIGLAVQGYVQDAGFSGTLAYQYGIWARHGTYISAPGSVITNSYGVFIDSLTNANTTITNLFGLYQANANAKNYFAGNVGIGTLAPNNKLTVSQATAPTIEIKQLSNVTAGDLIGALNFSGMSPSYNDAATSANPGASIRAIAASTWNTYLSADLAFLTVPFGSANPSEKMRITSNGNVGIGTTNPTHRLDVNGDVSLTATGHAYLFINGNTGDSEALWAENGANRWALGMNVGEGSQNFNLYNYTTGSTCFSVNKTNGYVGIGTTNPTQKLSVNGSIRAHEVIVDTGWSDYVFAADYALAPLSEIEAHIKAHHTLPGVPSASEVADHGISVGDMQAKLLAKIEELTLHQIAQEKTQAAQSARIERLENENLALNNSR
jgi:hypothetical protein